MSTMLQKRYEGYLKTPVLWKNKPLQGLKSFELHSESHHIAQKADSRLRLGKYVERLVSFELSTHKNITVLAENIQIQDGKTTIGELDCLFLKDQKPVHLEIVYKFYLYDDTVGTSEIDHFIGPNRKDALTEKLSKLKDKQLPLLHSEACKPYLQNLELASTKIIQEVYFKAQLFLPLEKPEISLKHLNSDCIYGFYFRLKDLKKFTSCKFYIPKKKDWLINPHPQVDWMTFDDFKKAAKNYVQEKFSPMVWIKSKNGELQKCFLVWW